MAAYDYASGGFPTSPVTNDTLAINGTSYIYNGSAWEVVGGTGSLYTESATAPTSPTNGDLWLDTDDDTLYQQQTSAWVQVSTTNMPTYNEGTEILSTGETGGTKYLREDGDGTSSWQAVAGGGIGSFVDNSIAISSDGTALANDDGTDNNNIGIGTSALNSNTTGSGSIGIGWFAGRLGNPTDAVFIGKASNTYAYSGNGTVAVGSNSCAYNGGSYNNGIGAEALRGNGSQGFTGSYNTGIGYQTGYSLTTGSYNVLNGYQAGFDLTTGSDNVSIGRFAGQNQTTSTRSIAIGYNALGLSAHAGNNVAIGYEAGWQTSASGNTMIGYGAGDNASSGGNVTCIGNGARPSVAAVANEITLGNTAVTSFRIPGLQATATSGDVLTYDGSKMTLATPAGGGGGFTSMVLLTSGTSWAIPSGVTTIKVTVTGGGSGGSGYNGGSSGATSIKYWDTSAGGTLTYAIGAGGSGMSNSYGGAGGNSHANYSGVQIYAYGAPSGLNQEAITWGGDFNITGSSGDNAGMAGAKPGAASYWHGGGRQKNSGIPLAGLYGSGGGGSYNTSNTGGSGGVGCVVIEY